MKNAAKPLTTRVVFMLLNLKRCQFSNRNADLRFLYEKYAKKEQNPVFFLQKGLQSIAEGFGE